MNSVLENLLYDDMKYKFIDDLNAKDHDANINGIATEGAIMDFIKNTFSFGKVDKSFKPDNLSQYIDIIDSNSNDEIFSKTPHTAFLYFTFKPVVIDNNRKIIVIQKLDFDLLIHRIRESYGERKLDSIFYRTYGSSEIKNLIKRN